jgi:catechol 2,3-dioxygenase-like lactoylglutathione lyase family enzyme
MRQAIRTIALLLAISSFPALADTKPAPGTDPGPAVMAPALRATDLDRSIKFYTTALDMVVIGRLSNGPVTEVFLNFAGKEAQPGLVLSRDSTSGKSPLVDHGNANSRIIMQMPDVAAIAARMKGEGYEAGDIGGDGKVKVLRVRDPDGYAFELVQMPPCDAKVAGSPP